MPVGQLHYRLCKFILQENLPLLFTWCLSYFLFFHFASLVASFFFQPASFQMKNLLRITSSLFILILVHLYPNSVVFISALRQAQLYLALPMQSPNQGWPCKTNSLTVVCFTAVAFCLPAFQDKSLKPQYYYLVAVKYKHFPFFCIKSLHMTATCFSRLLPLTHTTLLSLTWSVTKQCPWCVLWTIYRFPSKSLERKTWYSSRMSSSLPQLKLKWSEGR